MRISRIFISLFSILMLSLATSSTYAARWSTAVPLNLGIQNTYDHYGHSVAIDTNGNILATWAEATAGAKVNETSLWSTYYDRGVNTWSTPREFVQGGSSLIMMSPATVVDGIGRFHVSYIQRNSVPQNTLMYTSFDPSSLSWASTPTTLTIGNYFTQQWFLPRIAADSSGNVMVETETCSAAPNASHNVAAYHFDMSIGSFDSNYQILDNNAATSNQYNDNLKMTTTGKTLAVWKESDPAYSFMLYENAFDPTQKTWSGPTLVYADTSGQILSNNAISFDMDETMSGFAVFRFYNKGTSSVYYLRRDGTTGQWAQTPTLVDSFPDICGNDDEPTVDVNANGNAILVWQDTAGTTPGLPYQLYSSYYDTATQSWSATPLPIDVPQASCLEGLTVAMNNSGSAVATAIANGTNDTDILVSTFDPTAHTWSTFAVLDTVTGSAEDPHVTMSDNGTVVITWIQNDGLHNRLWGSVYIEACGDGVLDSGEMCDDGNANDGDGCSFQCQIETVADPDSDNDSYPTSTDCNDNDATINPGVAESCDHMDNNCNGTIDEGVKTVFYSDQDGDGFGSPSTRIRRCSAPNGFLSIKGDCDDNNATVHRGASEIANNGVDDNCNGVVDERRP